MSKLAVCAVRDVKVGAFARPIFVPSRGVAIRQFQDEVSRAADDNVMFKHPKDFELYFLGVFDDETGHMAEPEQPELLLRGSVSVSD